MEFTISQFYDFFRLTKECSCNIQTHPPLWWSLNSSSMQLRRAEKGPCLRAIWGTFAFVCHNSTGVICAPQSPKSDLFPTNSAHIQTAYWNLRGTRGHNCYSAKSLCLQFMGKDVKLFKKKCCQWKAPVTALAQITSASSHLWPPLSKVTQALLLQPFAN